MLLRVTKVDLVTATRKRKRTSDGSATSINSDPSQVSTRPLTLDQVECNQWHIMSFTQDLPEISKRAAERIMASIVAVPPSYSLDMRQVERLVYPNSVQHDIKHFASLGVLQRSAKIYSALDKIEKAVGGLQVADNFWLFQLGAVYKSTHTSDHDSIRQHVCPDNDRRALKKFGETLRKALRVYDLVVHIGYELVYTMTVPSTCYKNLSEHALRQVVAWSKLHYAPYDVRHPNKTIRLEAGVLLGCEPLGNAPDFTDPNDRRDLQDMYHSRYISAVGEDVMDYIRARQPSTSVVQGPMLPQDGLLSEVIVIEDDSTRLQYTLL